MTIRRIYTNKANATAIDLAILTLAAILLFHWQGWPMLLAVAVALTGACMGLLAGITVEVFGGGR